MLETMKNSVLRIIAINVTTFYGKKNLFFLLRSIVMNVTRSIVMLYLGKPYVSILKVCIVATPY